MALAKSLIEIFLSLTISCIILPTFGSLLSLFSCIFILLNYEALFLLLILQKNGTKALRFLCDVTIYWSIQFDIFVNFFNILNSSTEANEISCLIIFDTFVLFDDAKVGDAECPGKTLFVRKRKELWQILW
jgi:hypothetical protein